MRIAILALLLCASLTLASPAFGQSTAMSDPAPAANTPAPTAGSDGGSWVDASVRKHIWDFSLFTDGGHNVSGGRGGYSVVQFGGRWGFVLTDSHGPGWPRGNLEYGIGAVPLYIVPGPQRNAYGAGFDPFVARYNFTHWRKVAPYFELAGGMIFTNTEIPTGTSNINFTPQAALGAHIFTREKRSVTFEIKYLHISNAGLTVPNPGLNMLQGGIAFHWMK